MQFFLGHVDLCGLGFRNNEFCEDCISTCLTYINERVKETLFWIRDLLLVEGKIEDCPQAGWGPIEVE